MNHQHAETLRAMLADDYAQHDDDGSPSFTQEREALDAAIAALSGGGWLPMESAPRDGTPILVLLSEPMLGSLMHVAVLHNNVSTVASIFAFDAPPMVSWQPLPAANAQAARAQDAETDDYLLHALANAVEAIPVPREGFKAGWRDEEIWEWALRTAARAIRSTTRDGVAERDYAALQARIAELEARNAASERDAGRYRFIRSDAFDPSTQDDDLFYTTGETFDAAIDAAIDTHAQGQNTEEPPT